MAVNRRGKHRDLLHTPEGVRDIYGRENKIKRAVTKEIMHQFHLYGYEDIQTPTFEFFDVFSNEIGTIGSKELYKFFDKEGNTLVLRPDFTPSVARCAAKYFLEDKKPLRFCYEGSAFINTSNLQGKLKEQTQMGAELMNDGSAQADGEMIAMLIDALLHTGLTEFRISIGNVEYFRGLCQSLSMDEDTEEELRDAISGKNYFAAEDLLISCGYEKRDRDLFLKVTDFMDTAEDLERVESIVSNERSRSAVRRLLDVCDVLSAYGFEKYVSFDLSLLSKYHYYTGIIFKGYTYGTGEPVATGGRYDTLLGYFGKNAPAIGAMIQIDSLIEALGRQKIEVKTGPSPETVYYTEDNYLQALEKAKALRSEGKCAVLCPRED